MNRRSVIEFSAHLTITYLRGSLIHWTSSTTLHARNISFPWQFGSAGYSQSEMLKNWSLTPTFFSRPRIKHRQLYIPRSFALLLLNLSRRRRPPSNLASYFSPRERKLEREGGKAYCSADREDSSSPWVISHTPDARASASSWQGEPATEPCISITIISVIRNLIKETSCAPARAITRGCAALRRARVRSLWALTMPESLMVTGWTDPVDRRLGVYDEVGLCKREAPSLAAKRSATSNWTREQKRQQRGLDENLMKRWLIF